MVQRFYPCSYCLGQFTSRELILVGVASPEGQTRHWIVCRNCLEELEEMGILVSDETVLVEEPLTV